MAARNADIDRTKRIEFRIGINLGDIVIDGDDIHGSGVNMARPAADRERCRWPGIVRHIRPEPGQPGGCCFRGWRPAPLQEYRAFGSGVALGPGTQRATWASRHRLKNSTTAGQARDRRAAIQQHVRRQRRRYFSDGLTEDIITALTHWRSFPGIARNSCFAYKGKAVDIKKVARELGTGYVLEGSVRKGGSRVRITAQLIDGLHGHHLSGGTTRPLTG